MAINNVQTQLQKAIEMRETIIKFVDILNNRMQEYDDSLKYYVRMGFPVDISETYRINYFDPDYEIIRDLSSRMQREHIDYIDKAINALRKAADAR